MRSQLSSTTQRSTEDPFHHRPPRLPFYVRRNNNTVQAGATTNFVGSPTTCFNRSAMIRVGSRSVFAFSGFASRHRITGPLLSKAFKPPCRSTSRPRRKDAGEPSGKGDPEGTPSRSQYSRSNVASPRRPALGFEEPSAFASAGSRVQRKGR